MINVVDPNATGDIKFPNFLEMMCLKFSDNNAEDEIREAFKVFDNVSSNQNLPKLYSYSFLKTFELGSISANPKAM